ncbi:hypothetical protein LZ023_29005 [Pseudomonas silvicola]|nr:hypothetical protein LZ023_29005 [Pseudomonas silvicola]
MKKIDTSKLKKGDVILTTSIEPLSGKIRALTDSDISHAMIYVSDGSVMDSTSEGVQARNIQKMFYPDECAIHVLRLKATLTSADAKKIVNYVRSETGAPYSRLEAARSILNPTSSGGQNQFCSRLVARAYQCVGINLTDNPNFATPAQIQNSDLLEPVPGAVLDATEEDQRALEVMGDTTEQMRDVTDRLLQKIRTITKEARVVNDLPSLLVKNPKWDKKFLAAYKSSGYLEYWKVDVERFPWRYDYTEMVRFYHAIGDKAWLIKYCHDTVRQNHDGDYDHWKGNLEAHRQLYRQNPRLKTLGQLLLLYHELDSHRVKRLANAERLLLDFANSAPTGNEPTIAKHP